MQCEQAHQLFDAYLDRELSPALSLELDAHRLQCPECRRALALMEVSGHLLGSDRDSITLRRGFTDRLLACMETPRALRVRRVRRWLYVGGPMVAAAVVALAFLGVFDGRGDTRFAGEISVNPPVPEVAVITNPDKAVGFVADPKVSESPEQPPDSWFERMESVRSGLDLTILQLLDMLEKANEASPREGPFPGTEVREPIRHPKTDSSPKDSVEDL